MHRYMGVAAGLRPVAAGALLSVLCVKACFCRTTVLLFRELAACRYSCYCLLWLATSLTANGCQMLPSCECL
jgi:hypothetical protein